MNTGNKATTVKLDNAKSRRKATRLVDKRKVGYVRVLPLYHHHQVVTLSTYSSEEQQQLVN